MKWGAVVGGIAFAALASISARAADMTPVPQRTAGSGYIPAQFLWTGFYLRAGIGDGFGTSTFTDPFGGSASPSINGFLVSGVSGINYQIGSVVIGAEGDFTGAFAKGTAADLAGDSLQTKVFWTASITGRLGLAFEAV